MTFSIIIPAYNASETLPACLNALQNQSHPVSRADIIVVDDGSSDNTAALAEAAGVRVVRQANGGAATARNAGVAASQSEILLFTDADCVPDSGWVAAMLAPFAEPEVAGVKGVYRTRQRNLTARFVQVEYQHKYARMRPGQPIDFVDTYSAAYRRDVFETVGGFDTTYPGASVEDQEFSFRAAGAGFKLVFAPQAIVYHRHDRSVGEYARRKFGIGFWKVKVVRRHPDKLVQDSHTPQTLKVQMGLAALGGLGLVLAGLTRQRRFLAMAVSLWALLLASDFRFYQNIWQWDRPVLLIAPLLIFVRAWSLGVGFLLGLGRFRGGNK